MPKRLQRKRIKGYRMPEGSVYVGRGTRWGNPFVVGKDGTAEECLAKYAEHMLPYRHMTGTIEKFYQSEANLEDMIANLKGKDLVCWCALEDEHCHADWLIYMANITKWGP